MFELLSKIFFFFFNLWGSLSDSQKEKIIDFIVEIYEDIFREYFKANEKD